MSRGVRIETFEDATREIQRLSDLLEQLTADVGPGPWEPLTLVNGFTNYSSWLPLSGMKVGRNLALIAGMVTAGTATQFNYIATMPPYLGPRYSQVIAATGYNLGGKSAYLDPAAPGLQVGNGWNVGEAWMIGPVVYETV